MFAPKDALPATTSRFVHTRSARRRPKRHASNHSYAATSSKTPTKPSNAIRMRADWTSQAACS
eukprot:3735668-Pyramimonas_sp.AAC.1